MRSIRTCVPAAIAALALGLAPAATATTGNAGNYTVNVSPGSAVGGAQTAFTVAIANGTSSPYRIGAVNLTAPAGFQLVSASLPAGSPGSATIAGNTVQLRGVAINHGATLDVGVSADTACATGAYAWTAAATNEPNFTGKAFTLESGHSHLATTVSAACSLTFAAQPADTAAGQVIRAAAFNPSGPPVQVDVLDGNGNPSTSSSASVTVGLAANPGGGTLSGTTTVAAVNGVATFSDLSINHTGTGYELGASSPGITSATSNPFNVTTAGTSCPPGQTCSTSASTPTSSFGMTSPPGPTPNTLAVTVDSGTALRCNDYPTLDPNWYEFTSTSTSVGKVITYTVIPGSETQTVASAQFCLGAPYEFTTRSGAPAPAGTLPDGTSGFIGLLPDCTAGPPTSPCVDARSSTPDPNSPTGFDIVLRVVFPAGLPGDPWGRV